MIFLFPKISSPLTSLSIRGTIQALVMFAESIILAILTFMAVFLDELWVDGLSLGKSDMF
jgi:hypothetical protein